MRIQDLIENLKNLGFKEYEAKVFITLLNGKVMSASEIAKESGVIRNSIYDILKSFVEKGYCNEIETNTILKYQIIDPDVILDKITHDINSLHIEKISSVQNTFSEIKSLYKIGFENQPVSDTNIQLLRGFNKHRQAKYIELLKQSTMEVLGMYKLRALVLEEANEIAGSFIKKGGIIKSIYSVSLNFKIIKDGITQGATKDDLIRVCEFFEKQGEQVRLSEMDIPNITVFDREFTFINITDKNIPRNKHADVIIQNQQFAQNMSDLFEYYWSNSLSTKEFKNKL